MSHGPSILLVEDEPHLAKVVKDSLEQAGYKVVHAMDGKKAYNFFQNQHFDLYILDVMLPGTDGFTLARQIKAQQENMPVLFLTARTTTADVIEGYRSGGNDYLKKPFSLEELFLRVRELLKRNSAYATIERSFQIGNYVFTPAKQLLQLESHPAIKLSYRETQLLLLLVQHKNSLLDRKQALVILWGEDSYFHTRTMDVFMTKLRKYLGQDANVEIINIRGLGYKLIC